MTRSALLLLVVLLSACGPPRTAGAPPSAPADSTFDAAGWLAGARAALGSGGAGANVGAPLPKPGPEHVDALDAAVGWKRACDTYWDPEAAREVYHPRIDAPPQERGEYEIYDLGEGESVVQILCGYSAYQGSVVLVHVVGRRATVLTAPAIDLDGETYASASALYTMPSLTEGQRTFETFDKARGLADCGVLSTYRIAGFGHADAVEVRARACPYDNDPAAYDSIPEPSEWPVVYPRR